MRASRQCATTCIWRLLAAALWSFRRADALLIASLRYVGVLRLYLETLFNGRCRRTQLRGCDARTTTSYVASSGMWQCDALFASSVCRESTSNSLHLVHAHPFNPVVRREKDAVGLMPAADDASKALLKEE